MRWTPTRGHVASYLTSSGSNLAASYASLPLVAGAFDIAAVLAGLALAAGVAVLWVSRQTARETVVEGLAA